MISNYFRSFTTYAANIVNVLKSFGIWDILDVAAVAFIFYHALKLVRETRAMQFIKSIAVIFVLYFFANEFNMISLKFLLKTVLDIGLITLVILFQPELRRAMEQLGRSKLTDIVSAPASAGEEKIAQTQELIDVIAQSCGEMSAKRTGALMVIEREIKLGDVINSGTVIDSRAGTELVENIFFTNSPLHDGAMVIRNSRLYAAGCFLPLSGNMEIGRELGTRHRAALGMSEVSDAVVVVVSEETGTISVAMDSRLQRGLSVQNLHKLLTVKLIADDEEKNKKSGKYAFWKRKSRKKDKAG